MVVDHVINWVTDEQIELIKEGKKRAFIRMEDKWKIQLLEGFREGNEIQLHIRTLEPRAWLKIIYVDYFKWKELKIQPILIQRCGYENKRELKVFLKKLYGIELFGRHLEEKPYLYYIEFDYNPFPENPSQ